MTLRLILFAVFAISVSSVTAQAADKSWEGRMKTHEDENLTGKLLFAKGKLFVNAGTPEERSFDPGEIKEVVFIGAENAGT